MRAKGLREGRRVFVAAKGLREGARGGLRRSAQQARSHGSARGAMGAQSRAQRRAAPLLRRRAQDRRGGRRGHPPCRNAGRRAGRSAGRRAGRNPRRRAGQTTPGVPGAIRWKVLELVRAYTDSEKKWRHKEILEKRKWTGEWDFDRQTEEAKKARVTPPEPLEPDTDSSGPCFDAGPSNGGGNVMPTKSESEGRGGCRGVVGAPGYD